MTTPQPPKPPEPPEATEAHDPHKSHLPGILATPEQAHEPRIDSAASASSGDDNEQPTVLSTIRQLQNGSITGKSLAPADRRACTEHLTNEGCSVAEIAEILKVSERTIIRDRKAIQQTHALAPHSELVPQMVGRLFCEAELAIQRIRRASREKQVPVGIKVDAEHRCFQIVSDLVQRLQGLGYLPTATQRVEADLLHRTAEVPDIDSLSAELARLREVSVDSDGNVPEEVRQLEGEFERASLAVRVQRTAAVVHSEKGTADE